MFNSQKNTRYTFVTLQWYILIKITRTYTTTFGKLNNIRQITRIMQNETAGMFCRVYNIILYGELYGIETIACNEMFYF